MSELTVQPPGGCTVGVVGFLRIREEAKINLLTIYADSSSPLPTCFVHVDALVPTWVVVVHRTINFILPVRGQSQIRVAVVKRSSSSDVVYLKVWWCIKNHTMHEQRYTAAIYPLVPGSIKVAVDEGGVPSVLGHRHMVRSIYQRYLPLRKWYHAIIGCGVGFLRNQVHGRTSQCVQLGPIIPQKGIGNATPGRAVISTSG
jgi:hypothetical protein